MRLFDLIPENFFSVLASPNREIYADALMVLYDSLGSDEMSIKKSDYLRALREKATNQIMAFDVVSDEEDELDEDEVVELRSQQQTLASKTAYVVRRLEEAGWFEVEIDSRSFEEYIALPAYSIQFMELMYKMTSAEEAQYVSLVHATYSELRLEDDEPDEFMYATLLRAYENTKKLRTELITLAHSIRIYQNRLGRVFSTNGVLRDYFDSYKEHISDRFYHPLKTFDSVAKFKRPIISILQRWLYDPETRETLLVQARVWNRKKDPKESEKDLINMINYICDMYETLSEMIDEIDGRHQDYTKASASKILYLNNTDKTIKGHLDTIFKTYAEIVVNGDNLTAILNGMQNSINLTHQGFIGDDALTYPIVRKYRQLSEALQIVDYDDLSIMLMEDFLDETRNIFTDARVYDFMETAFGDSSEVNASEIPLVDLDAFILLILASLKSNDQSAFYSVEDNEQYIINGIYRIPNFTFKRKELEA